MSRLPIRYVSFDCYGTLIDFRIGDVARDRLAARVPADLEDFTAYRFDDVLGAWKPYREVLHRSYRAGALSGEKRWRETGAKKGDFRSKSL
jgi:2-haloacid dehalogenase